MVSEREMKAVSEKEMKEVSPDVKLLILGLTALFAIRGAEASQLTDEGMRFYNAGQFDKAGAYFEAEIKANPNDATAHYLLGNSFVKLNRVAEAQAAYERAIMLDPKGNVGQYSLKAKEGLSAQALKTSSSADSSLRPLPPPSQSPAAPDFNDTKSSALAVSKQTDETEKRISAECDARVTEIQRASDRKIQSLQREMSERMSANVWVGRSNRVTTYDPSSENQAIREEYAPQIKAIREDTQKQIDAVKASYKDRLAACETSAVTVDRSYVSPTTGNVRLVPAGTSLYTRNYQSDGEASGNAVPVLATPKRLVDMAH